MHWGIQMIVSQNPVSPYPEPYLVSACTLASCSSTLSPQQIFHYFQTDFPNVTLCYLGAQPHLIVLLDMSVFVPCSSDGTPKGNRLLDQIHTHI